MANDNLADDQQTTQIDVEPAGEWFRKAREAKHLTLDEVAKELRLKADIIKAIEDDDIENLPPTTYLFGYVRNYARMLGLPADEAVNRYENIDLKKPELIARALRNPRKPVETPASISKSKVVLVVLLLVVLAGAGLAIFQNVDLKDILRVTGTSEQQAKSSDNGVVEQHITLQPAAEPQPEQTGNEVKDQQTQGEQALATTAEAPPETSQPSAAADLGWPSETTEATQQQPAAKEASVVLQFAKDCWTEIKDAQGERLVFDLMKAGTRKEIHGQAPISVFLGNAEGVTVTFNNRNFDIGPYVHGHLAQFTLE